MYYNCIYVPIIFNYFLIFVGLVCAAHVEFIIRRIANSLKVFIEHYYLGTYTFIEKMGHNSINEYIL